MTDADADAAERAATIAAGLAATRARIAAACAATRRDPAGVTLLAVSKTHPFGDVAVARALGQLDFGENRVQELTTKAAVAAAHRADVRWHMIGSVQTNKAAELVRTPGLVLVHSLDRVRLADALQQACAAAGRTLDVLLQIRATDEPTKHGVAPADAQALLAHVASACPSLSVIGLMAMGPANGDPTNAFAAVSALAQRLRDASGAPLPVSSLGMSGDLEAAIAAGSTLLRIGSAIFGQRD